MGCGVLGPILPTHDVEEYVVGSHNGGRSGEGEEVRVSDRTRLTNLTTEMSALANDNSVPESVRVSFSHLVNRINQCVQDILIQINSAPVIYVVDPRTNPTAVKGARPGDICVFKNTEGDVEIMQF